MQLLVTVCTYVFHNYQGSKYCSIQNPNMAATAEEEVILKHRLLTHTAVSKGDPPFKKLAKRYLQFCQAAQDNTKDVDDLYKTLVKDLTAIQFQVWMCQNAWCMVVDILQLHHCIQMEKMQFQCESLEYERELYERKQAQLQSDIQQVCMQEQ